MAFFAAALAVAAGAAASTGTLLSGGLILLNAHVGYQAPMPFRHRLAVLPDTPTSQHLSA